MRTKQDMINRRDANRRYYKLKENKETRCAYQRKYSLGLIKIQRHTKKFSCPC